MSSDTIVLKVRLVDKKVFKKFQFFPKKSVKEARLFIAKELEVDPEQYGLFLPPRDDQNGIWFRDDYPLDFYGLEGENDQKEAMLFSSKPEAPLMEFVEFKKRYRPIKVTKGGDQYKTVMVDDTMNVADAITNILTQVPASSAISESELFSMSEDEVEVLSGDMTIREQGYVGECTTGLLKTSKGEINLYVKVPYCEGWIMRKRGGNIMKGIKNWNKRWYTLKKNKLVYHKAKGLGPEMGCIWMKTVQTVRPVRNVADIPNKYAKSCFEIVTPARTYVMLANSATEMKKWVDILDFSRRMFAYETHFFGVANKITSSGSKMSLIVKGNSASEESDASESEDESYKKKKREEDVAAAAAAAEQEKQRLAKEEEERAARKAEEERLEREAEEARRKAHEEEEELKRQHEEFLEKQRQLELEKQKQLQDQLEEDRRLEELMQQMEMEQEERVKIKEDQERLEKERHEAAKKLEEEQERVRKEVERLEQERQEAERKEQERLEQERQETERKEQERREREEREREERQREIERARLLEEEIEKQRQETERLEQERQMLLEQERLEQERLLAEQEENEADDLLQQLEQESQEEEQRQLAAKRLKSMQARLECVEAETPDLKFLLHEASVSTPENLLIAWANYITVDCKIPSKPILTLHSVEANLEKYTNLLHKLEPESFSLQALQASSTLEKAQLIVQELEEFGVNSIKVEQLLSDDVDTQVNVLLTVYEEVGGNWEEEFQTQVVSKRQFATKYISHILQDSQVSNLLPSTPFEMLKSTMDGQILCYLINKIFPGTVDERVVKRNMQVSPKSNLNIAINCSRALGAKHEGITKERLDSLNPSDLHNIVWEIVEACLLQAADPTKQRSLFHLMRAESRNAFSQLEREKVMLRWFNYHLRKTQSGRQINNFSDDMEDCENYAYLFEAIAPKLNRKDEILNESDWERRAEIVLDIAGKLGCLPLLTPRDIVETENSKLNLLFVADLMRCAISLPAYNFSVDEQLVDQVAKSSEQSNNDQQLLDWINQMQLGIEASSLLEDFRDGTLFLKVFDKVLPAGSVDQKKLKIVPNSVFKKLELFNYTMEICHKLKLNVAGIAGTDLLNGDIRSNRAILNQIRRYLGDKVTIDVVTAHQTAALKWANSKVDAEATKVKPIQSFKDQFLQDSLFLLELLESLKPNSIERNCINNGSTLSEEQVERNARYFLTAAWSAGYPLQVLWEDVTKVRSKSIKHIIETFQE